MGVMSDLDAELTVIEGVFKGREPLAQWLNSLRTKTDDLVSEVTCQAYRFLSKAEMLEALEIDESDLHLMARIGSRLQFIAASIDVRDPPKFKVIK